MPTSRLRLAPEVAGRLSGALERLRARLVTAFVEARSVLFELA